MLKRITQTAQRHMVCLPLGNACRPLDPVSRQWRQSKYS